MVEMLRPEASMLRLSKSTADLVADVLRDEIISGRIAPQQQIVQDEIASRLGVSKIPVREALRTLEAEGFVTSAPRRGTVASQISVQEVREGFEIRLALEPLLLRLAIRRLTDECLGSIEAALRELQSEQDRRRWGAAHWAFHRALYEPAQHALMLRILSTIHHHIDRFLRQRMHFLDTAHDEAYREHAAILAACRRRDEKRACSLLTRHIRGAERVFVAYARQQRGQDR